MAARTAIISAIVALCAGLAAAAPVQKDRHVYKALALSLDSASDAADDLACEFYQVEISARSEFVAYLSSCSSAAYVVGNYTVQSLNDDRYLVAYGASLCDTDPLDDTYFSYQSQSYDGNFLYQNDWKHSQPYASYFPKVVIECTNLIGKCQIQTRICLGSSDTSSGLAAN